MSAEDASSASAEGVLTSLAATIGEYLEPPALLVLSKTSRACRQAYWTNDSLWKAVVQSQLWLFPDQEDFPATNESNIPWRQQALTMQNILQGRYRLALLDPNLKYDTNDSDDSDYEDDGSASECEREDVNMDYCSEEELVPPDDSPTATGTQDVPQNILIGGLAKHMPLWQLCCGAHRAWADILYQHYLDNIRDREQQPRPTDYSSWSYDYPFLNEEPTEFGTQRSCPLDSDTNGALVFTSWQENLGVVNVGAGKDEIVRRLTGYGPQEWQMGYDMVIGYFYDRGPPRLQCHYNLLDPLSEHKAYLPLETNQCSVKCAHGDYALMMGESISLVYLDRAAGILRIVHRSEMLCTQIKRMIFALSHSEKDKGLIGQRLIVSPDELTEKLLNKRTNHSDEEEEDCEYHFNFQDMMVFGRILILSVCWQGKYVPQSTVLVVDVKTDTVLYALRLVEGTTVSFGGNQITGGVLALRERGPRSFSVHPYVGVLFGPSLPRFDAAHSKLVCLLEATMSAKENPFHRHPNTRLPLHALLELPLSEQLCYGSDQCLLVDLEVESMMLDTQVPTTQIVYLDPIGEMCGRDRHWSVRDDESDPRSPRNDAWLRNSTVVSLLYPAPPSEASCFSAYLESASLSGGKFWSVYQQGPELTIVFGKVGTRGNISTTSMGDVAKALAHAQYKYYERRNKGYKHVSGKQAIRPTKSTIRKRRGQKVAPVTSVSDVDTKRPAAKKAKTAALNNNKNKKAFSAYLSMESSTGGKFWSVYQCENEVTISFGRVGTRGNITTTTMDSAAQALKDAKTKLSQKKKKGYVLIKGKEAIEPEIEVALPTGNRTVPTSVPVSITGHWRSIGSQHANNQVVKFVLSRFPPTNMYRLFHQECNVKDGVFYRTQECRDVNVTHFDEDRAINTFEKLASLFEEGDREIRRQVVQKRRADQLWTNVEISVDCEGSSLPFLLFVRSVSTKSQMQKPLAEKEQAFLDSLQELVGLSLESTSVSREAYKGREDAMEERQDMDTMPLYL